MPRNLVLFDLEWNIGYKPYLFNYHGVQQTFRGEIVGSGKAAVLGGIAGQNQGVIINCGNRGGKIEAVELDKGVKGENLGGIAGQISKGSDGKGNYIVNCFSSFETKCRRLQVNILSKYIYLPLRNVAQRAEVCPLPLRLHRSREVVVIFKPRICGTGGNIFCHTPAFSG